MTSLGVELQSFSDHCTVDLEVLCDYGEATILTVTYGDELLYLQIWRYHLVRSVHIIIAARFTNNLNACMI